MSYYRSLELLKQCDTLDAADLIDVLDHMAPRERSRALSVSSQYELPELEPTTDQHDYLINDLRLALERAPPPPPPQEVRTGPGRPRKYKKPEPKASTEFTPVLMNALASGVTVSNFLSSAESANRATRLLVDNVAEEGAKGLSLKALDVDPHGLHGVEIALKVYNRRAKEKEKEALEGAVATRKDPNTVLANGFTIQNYTDALARLIESKALNLPNITPDQILNLVESPAFQNNKMITELVRQTVNMKRNGGG